MAKIVKTYLPHNNPGLLTIPGVPLGDLTDEGWKALEKWQQKSVDGSGFWEDYVPTKAETRAAEKAAAADEAPDAGDQTTEGGKT
jgi:hypothetical protein